MAVRQRSWTLVILAAVVSAFCSRERDIMGNPIDGSHRVNTFVVLDGRSAILWKMSAPGQGVRSGENVEYGKVPAGFKQEIPAGDASPRPMIQGERLLVVIVTPEYVYRGLCLGAGPTEPRCETWESAPTERSVIERALRGDPIGRAAG